MLAVQSKVHVCLSMEQRLDILRQLEDGVPMKQLTKDYNVSIGTIRRIRREADKIRRFSQTPGGKGKKNIRKPRQNELLMTRLYEWYQEQQAVDDSINNLVLQKKAIEINKELGGPSSFTASTFWIWRFKRRNGIKVDNFRSENVKGDGMRMVQFTQCFLEHLTETGIKLQNVYSMDETGLVWKALPHQTLIDNLAKRVYGKKIKKNRVTVGLCANAIGTHKLPPLFVHKSETPIALKHCKDHLPVVFKAQKNACVDQHVFTDWIEKHFKPAVRKHQLETDAPGKVLLLLNKCEAHTMPPQIQIEDEDIKVGYLPVDMSSALHPMQQGIIKKVKVSFHRRILRRILDFPGGVAEFYADYDVKDCIDLVAEAWADVTQVDIYNSWKKLVGPGAVKVEETEEEQSKEHPYSMSDIISIKNTIKTITGEPISDKQVEKWLSICDKAERTPDDFEKQEEEEDCFGKKTILRRDEDEMDRMIAKVTLWSEGRSDIVKYHMRVVKDYYELLPR